MILVKKRKPYQGGLLKGFLANNGKKLGKL
jgi:hypothetical protein